MRGQGVAARAKRRCRPHRWRSWLARSAGPFASRPSRAAIAFPKFACGVASFNLVSVLRASGEQLWSHPEDLDLAAVAGAFELGCPLRVVAEQVGKPLSLRQLADRIFLCWRPRDSTLDVFIAWGEGC